MMTISYNNIIETFRQFVENHYFLKTFSHGSNEDVDQGKNTEYPLLHVVYSGATYGIGDGEKQKTFGLEIFILDNPLDKVDKVPIQKEVISDCEKCAEDILNDITNGFNIFLWAQNTWLNAASTQVLEEETHNTLAGVLLSLSLNTAYDYNACDLPLTPVVAPPSGDCLPSTYINSDGSFTVEIPSGSTYTSSNITLTEVDGSTSSEPTNINLTCTWIPITLVNSLDSNIGTIASFPVGGESIVIDTPITNSDGTFSANAPSGETYTAPNITLTEVDGSVSPFPSLKDLVCTWANIRVNNTVGTGLLNITSYPAGGNATLPDVLVDVKNSAGTTIEAGVDYENNGEIEIADAEIEDSAGTTFDRPICKSIYLPDTTINSVTVVGDLMTINTPTAATPSGICYAPQEPLFNSSFTTGDSWSNFLAGKYDRTPPTYPEFFAEVDYTATQADVRGTPATGTLSTDSVAPTMLSQENAFGNKFRYTDDAGNASDATVGSNIWAHVDWNGHSWTGATTGYVIDHLTGMGYSQSYLLDGAKFNMTTADGQSWALWLAYIEGLGTYLGYTGWFIIDGADMKGAHGAKAQPDTVWADNFFNFQRSDNRGSFLTGENCTSTLYYNINDSGNNDMMVDVSKSTTTGFADVITNIFIKRKHY